jgi:hypothetical protein
MRVPLLQVTGSAGQKATHPQTEPANDRRQAGLATTSGARQGQQPRACQRHHHCLEILTTTDTKLASREELRAWQILRDRGDLSVRMYLTLTPVYGTGWDTDNVSCQIFSSGVPLSPGSRCTARYTPAQ